MLRSQRSCRQLLVPAAMMLCLLLLIGGCSKKPVTLTGKLVLPPNIKLHDTDNVQINFAPVEVGEPNAGAAFTKSDMSFVCKNITPGKYKVSVMLSIYKGTPDSEKREYEFKMFNKTHSQDMNLNFEVTSDPEQSVTIDLVNGKVKKN
jgi:hypothetical protein